MITSTANKQIKELTQLIKKSKARREERVFVVEGIRMFVEAPEGAGAGGLCVGELFKRPGAYGMFTGI